MLAAEGTYSIVHVFLEACKEQSPQQWKGKGSPHRRLSADDRIIFYHAGMVQRC